jgi:hypothetical protein
MVSAFSLTPNRDKWSGSALVIVTSGGSLAAILRAWRVGSPQRPLLTQKACNSP